MSELNTSSQQQHVHFASANLNSDRTSYRDLFPTEDSIRHEVD